MRPFCFVRFAAFAAVLALAPGLAAQTVPARGADDTFDVASWNIEHFGDPGYPPSDPLQISNVEAVIAQAEIDLWAVQEIGSQGAWSELLTGLQDDGYTGRLGPETPFGFQVRLGFIYDPSVVQVIGTRTILSGGNFGGRAPFEMQARVTVGGESRTLRVIGIHAKALTDADDYADRVAGAAELKAYIDDLIERGEDVILLGDFNDYLRRSTRQGETSPYRPFVTDEDYVAATLAVENAGLPTYCSNAACTSGSTLDHVLFTAGLSTAYVAGSGDRFDEVLSGVSSYVSTTSDHLPVLARFSFLPTAADDGPEAGPVALLAPTPNPFRGDARLRFRLSAPGDVRLGVFDALGRRVASLAGSFGEGTHTVPLDGATLAAGTYVVRLEAAGVVRTRLLVRAE